MDYEDEENFDPGVDGGAYDEQAMLSPIQMLMGAGMFGTVTPEGKQKAAEVFEDLYTKRSGRDAEQTAAYNDYETRAMEARAILQRAREELAAKRVPSTKWLEMARGFGSPTRTGAFGESIANYAGARIPGRQREAQWEDDRTQQLLGYDQGVNNIDQALALQRLKLRQLGYGADDRLMTEAMKIMGKPAPVNKGPASPQQKAQQEVDKKYATDYVEFIQTGAANANADIQALRSALNMVKGIKTDPKTGQRVQGKAPNDLSGPIIGIMPKMVRDIITPRASETQEDVESVAQKSMRTIMGPQFTQKEGENLLARVWNPRFAEHVNAKRVERLLSQISRAYDEKVRAAKFFEENGTLGGFKGRTSWTLSMFDPDIPHGQSVLDEIRAEASSIMGDKAEAAETPAEDQPDYEWEWGEPAKAKGGRVGYAEGGQVRKTADGRNIYTMPDGKSMGTPGNITYEQALERWQSMTSSSVPTREGIPPQVIPGPDGEEETEEIIPPQEDDENLPLEEVSFPDRVGEEMPEALGMSAAGAAGAMLGNRVLQGGISLVDGETAGQRRILDMLESRKVHPRSVANYVRQNQRLGVPSMALDQPDMRLVADAAFPDTGGKHATETLARLRERADQGVDRVSDAINTGLKPDEYFDEFDKLTNKLYTNAKPLYDAAYAAHQGVKTQQLYKILETPDGKKAVKAALRLMRNDPNNPKKIGKADVTGMIRQPSLEFLDNVKRGFDQLIIKEEGTGVNHQSTPLGKVLRSLRTSLVNELDTATADPKTGKSLYAEARAQYAGDLEIRDALVEGRDDFIKMQPRQLEKKLASMPFAAKDAYRSGVAQKLYEVIGTPSSDTNTAKKLIGSPIMQKKLQLLFDSPKQFELFRTAMEREAEMFEADSATISKARQGQLQHAGPQPNAIHKIVKATPRLGIGSPMMWAMQWIRNMKDQDEDKIDDVIKHLKASTPEELADFEKTLGRKFKRRLGRKSRAGKAAVVGAAATAGAHAYDEATEGEDDGE